MEKAMERRIQVRLPVELAEKIEQEAKEMGVGRGVVIRWAVKERYQKLQEARQQLAGAA